MWIKKESRKLKKQVPDLGMPLYIKAEITIFFIFAAKDCNDTLTTHHGKSVYFQ